MRHQNVSGKAMGELGKALAEIVERDFSTVPAFAKRIGYTPWTVWRWITNDKVPSAEAAACLVVLYPGLQALLETKGCYKRKVLPLGKRAETTAQSEVRIEVARREAAAHAADLELPWPSASTKDARRPLLVLLAEARRARMRQKPRKTPRVRAAEPAHRNRVSHRGDFMDRMDEMTTADVRIATTYMTEAP
jgi:hypothetical protein